MRITPNNITELGVNEIFVFGSNESGRHGKGAAKTAMGWGAKYGQGSGLQGRTYGIPTKNASVTNRLSLSKIQAHVDNFKACAVAHPELKFLVTEIGCGLAGFNVKEIGPLFKGCEAMENVWLPQKFLRLL